jgi:transketolase
MKKKIDNIIKFSKQLRKDCLKMVYYGKSSHIGSILSIIDIVSVLYCKILNINTKNYKNKNRNYFILSKGHAGAAVYAALSNLRFFSKKKLFSHCQNGSTLSGHISHIKNKGIEFSTGSLGHGLSVAAGLALGSKLNKQNSTIYSLLSDGECNEGLTWEAAMFAGFHKLSNLICIIDYNKLQSLTTTTKTLDLEPFEDKWISFNWDVYEVDGHNLQEIIKIFRKINHKKNLKPSCIIAHTIKGKGVSFMENKVLWHYRAPNKQELEKALIEI